MANQCICCNKDMGFFSIKRKIRDGAICGDCATEAGIIKNRDYDDDFFMFTAGMVQELRQQNLDLARYFPQDDSVRQSKMDSVIQFNDEAKVFMILKTMYCRDYYRYNQIHAFHLIDRVSGGYCRNMSIKITLSDSPRNCVFIPIIKGDVSTSSSTYTSAFSMAHEIVSHLAIAKKIARGNQHYGNRRPRRD